MLNIFGEKGLIESITDILIKTGVVKDPENIKTVQKALEGYQAEVKDRASARQREAEVKDHTNKILSYITIIGFFGFITLLFYVKMPDNARNMISILVGYLGANVQAIYNYYFGSSAGSADKSKTLVNMLKK